MREVVRRLPVIVDFVAVLDRGIQGGEEVDGGEDVEGYEGVEEGRLLLMLLRRR